MTRILYVVRSCEEDVDVARGAAFLRQSFGETYSVIDSATDFRTRASDLGGYDAWKQNCATGIEYGSFEPRFHIFIHSGPVLGRAGAHIAQEALKIGKPVFWIESGDLRKAVRVEIVNDEDWMAGWRLRDG